jgi:hypothetical protein
MKTAIFFFTKTAGIDTVQQDEHEVRISGIQDVRLHHARQH